MAVRIKNITFGCADPYRLAQFWPQLTGFREDPDASARPRSSPNRPLPSSGWPPSSAARSAQDAERMTDPPSQDPVPARLRRGIVVRVREDACEIVRDRQLCSVRYATVFPSPRTERVSPGHLVAIATAPDGTEVVVWRWYDAVVLGAQAGLIRLWEPSHGEVLAQPRPAYRSRPPGTRAYLSAGLPGADWWVAGGAAASAEDADVELDEVGQFCTERDLWNTLV
jgi:hypothetical protein